MIDSMAYLTFSSKERRAILAGTMTIPRCPAASVLEGSSVAEGYLQRVMSVLPEQQFPLELALVAQTAVRHLYYSLQK